MAKVDIFHPCQLAATSAISTCSSTNLSTKDNDELKEALYI
jgi:hypothetical protein